MRNPTEPPPPAKIHFDRSQIVCQRCRRTFEHFTLEEIDDVVQLRCGDVLVSRADIVCLHCGWVFHWSVKEKDLERMALKYGELIIKMRSYNPE